MSAPVVILANFMQASRIARERKLDRRDWIWGGSRHPLRSIVGPVEVIVGSSWVADFEPAFRAEVEQRITVANATPTT